MALDCRAISLFSQKSGRLGRVQYKCIVCNDLEVAIDTG